MKGIIKKVVVGLLMCILFSTIIQSCKSYKPNEDKLHVELTFAEEGFLIETSEMDNFEALSPTYLLFDNYKRSKDIYILNFRYRNLYGHYADTDYDNLCKVANLKKLNFMAKVDKHYYEYYRVKKESKDSINKKNEHLKEILKID